MDADCRQILAELQVYLDGESPEQIHHVVSVHLEDCTTCMSRAEFEQAFRHVVAARCSEAAPAELARRIVAALRHAT